MTGRRKILVVILLTVVIGAVIWDPLHLREPWYGGKPISKWLALYGDGPRDYTPSPQTDDALRHLGEKSVPYLLELLHSTKCKTPVDRSKLPIASQVVSYSNGSNVSVLLRMEAWLEKRSPVRFHPVEAPASWDHWRAFLAFQALGPLGKPAIPDLLNLARDPAGSGSMVNVQTMTNLDFLAKLADNSATYTMRGDGPLGSKPGGAKNQNGILWGISSRLRATNSFLVDGDIAACSLATMGQEGVAPLLQLLAEEDPQLKTRAAIALGMIGSAAELAVPELSKCLEHPHRAVRSAAANALGWIAKNTRIAIPALITTLKDSDLGVKCFATDSLGRFGPSASNAVSSLLANFADQDYRIRSSAAVALGKISRETTEKEVLPVLVRQFEDSRPPFRNEAIINLSQLHMRPEMLIPVFTRGLDDTDDSVRMNSIRALEWFGPQAKECIPKLIALKTDTNPFVRKDAAKALGKINSVK